MLSSSNQTQKSPKNSASESSKSTKNRPQPRTYLDNDDIRCVASPFFFGGQNNHNHDKQSGRASLGISNLVITSSEIKNVLLDRLEKEIMSKLGGGFCRRSEIGEQNEHGNKTDWKRSANDRHGRKRRRVDHPVDSSYETVPSETKVIGIKLASKKIDSQTADIVKVKELPPITISEWIVRKRFVVGINQCTKILESALQRRNELQSKISPNLSQESGNGSRRSDSLTNTRLSSVPILILLSRDVRPATILAHISIYAHILKIPVAILPGKSSVDLGKVVGIRSVAVAMFLPSFGIKDLSEKEELQLAITDENRSGYNTEWKDCHQDVDSFIDFVKSKIPKME